MKTAFTLRVDKDRRSHANQEIVADYNDVKDSLQPNGKNRLNPSEGPSGPLGPLGDIFDGTRAENLLEHPLPYTRGYDGGAIGPEGYIVK